VKPVVAPKRNAPASIEVPPGAVRILESLHATDFSMEMGVWEFHKLCWVAVGRGKVEMAEGQYALRQDDLILLPAGCVHRFIDDPNEPLTLVILCISEQFVAPPGRKSPREDLWRTLKAKIQPGKPLCARTGFHHSIFVENFRLALREQSKRESGWQTALGGVADQFLIALNRDYVEARVDHTESSHLKVAGIIEFIDAHPYQRPQIADMADRCGLSPRHFTDIFKELSGETFNAYLNKKRIEYACERLRETEHILYACHQSGFNDLAYFYRVFKKQTGQTPGDYLKAVKAKGRW